MKKYIVITCLLMGYWTQAQELGFDCDASIYLVSYTESTGKSTLYKVTENDTQFSYDAIDLSEDRRLTSLAYNVLDKHLYALDVDSYELIKINRLGEVLSLGVPENIDQTYEFHAGTISPDGSGIFLIGYSPEFDYDNRFYTINLSRATFYAGYLGVTGDTRAEVHDFATDPLSGEIYGYDNKEGRLAQIGVGGQITLLQFPTTGVTDIDGVFFNQEGELFAYSARRGFYSLDKLHGTLEYLSSGPQGTSGDACSCPYTSTFYKEITPREIAPCQEFEVSYKFQNQLGIGQTWVSLRDTFPEGFEVVDVESGIVSSINIADAPANVLALDNLIYLMRGNEIKVTVRAPADYTGQFGSRAVHWDFPFAFSEVQYTDDPDTETQDDMTMASVVTSDELNLIDMLSFSCDGSEAYLASPIDADYYNWSTGDSSSSIVVDRPGWYSLLTENDCFVYDDSIFIEGFLEDKSVMIQGPQEIVIGESVLLAATINRGNPVYYEWISDVDTINCTDCNMISVMPSISSNYRVYISDAEGCYTMGEIDIEVEEKRSFYAATVFSPNNDGINDRFYLQSSLVGEVENIQVFNRWGNIVYEASDIPINDERTGWDGMSNNTPVDMGVYIWVAQIKYFDGLVEQRSGSITILGVQ